MSAFDPYHNWLGIPPTEQPANYYRLLGLALFEDNPEVIESAADRQMAHIKTFAAGQRAELSQKLLNEIARAKLCLLQSASKAAYDDQLRQSLLPPPLPPAEAAEAAEPAEPRWGPLLAEALETLAKVSVIVACVCAKWARIAWLWFRSLPPKTQMAGGAAALLVMLTAWWLSGSDAETTGGETPSQRRATAKTAASQDQTGRNGNGASDSVKMASSNSADAKALQRKPDVPPDVRPNGAAVQSVAAGTGAARAEDDSPPPNPAVEDSAAEKRSKRPVPGADELAEAGRLVDEAFGDELAAATAPDARIALSQALLEQAWQVTAARRSATRC